MTPGTEATNSRPRAQPRAARTPTPRGRRTRPAAARRSELRLRATVRPLVAVLCVCVATVSASACGGSTYATGSQTAVARPTTTATATPKTTYRTQLEHDVAQAFEAALLGAYLSTPRPPTLSQIPPRVDLLVREPATVCTHLHPDVYRCSVTYQLRSSPHPARVIYSAKRRRACLTATATALPADNTLHHLKNCTPARARKR